MTYYLTYLSSLTNLPIPLMLIVSGAGIVLIGIAAYLLGKPIIWLGVILVGVGLLDWAFKFLK